MKEILPVAGFLLTSQDMKKIAVYICLVVCVLVCCSCTKNEFSIEGHLQGKMAKSLRFVYYASDSKRGLAIEAQITVLDGKLQLQGITRNPTLVWVLDDMNRVVNMIYAERGDKLEVKGELSRPWSWEISGNKTEEALSGWMRQNGSLLLSDKPDLLNRAIREYVEAHPEDLVSGLLISGLYRVEPGKEKVYAALLEKLPETVRANAAVLGAGGLELHSLTATAAQRVSPFTLYSLEQKPHTIDPHQNKATVLYFWQSDDGKTQYNTANRDMHGEHTFNMIMLKNLRERFGTEDLFVADINSDLDTLSWQRAARRDTIAEWVRLWEPGFGQGQLSARLGVNRHPWLIVIDRTGSIRYQGINAADTENAVKKILNIR